MEDVSEDNKYNNSLYKLSEEEISDITEEEELDIDLNNLDSIMLPHKAKIYSNEKPYNFSKEEERADVYIKNYLMKFDMKKSLKILEQEFFELLSKGEIKIEEIPNVPKAYIVSEQLQEKIGNIQRELDDAKIYAEKANSLFLKLHQAKENAKIKHRRVQQEKQKLIKEVDKMKKVYEDDNKIYKELKKKHWEATKITLVLEQDIKGLSSKVDNLNEQIDKIKKTIDESKKQKERNYKIYYIYYLHIELKELTEKKIDKKGEEEKIGSKIIKWTPYPTPPKNTIDYSQIDQASINMKLSKIFPVIYYI
jgi:hypothetical protein